MHSVLIPEKIFKKTYQYQNKDFLTTWQRITVKIIIKF